MGKPVAGEECDISCLRAKRPECKCRCRGRNHGVLKLLEGQQTLDGQQPYIWLGHVEMVVKLFAGYVCPLCGAPLDVSEVYGYPHDDGLVVENYNMRLWVFARCKCGYDVSWRKLGSPKTIPEWWAK